MTSGNTEYNTNRATRDGKIRIVFANNKLITVFHERLLTKSLIKPYKIINTLCQKTKTILFENSIAGGWD